MATPTLSRHTVAGVLGPILVDVRTSDRSTPRPAVVVLHGFKGFKDWGMFPPFAERVARAGFTAVSFNLSGSGVDEQGEFVHLDRFGHNTFSAELEDTRRVLDALAAGELGVARTAVVGLVGHSRGGGIGVLAADRDRRIQALVTWAGISFVDRWADRKTEWRARGRIDVPNARTGQVLPLYLDLLEDVDRHVGELDILAAAGRLTVPWLILHGSADGSVPAVEAEALARAAQRGVMPGVVPPRLMLLEGAGHTFGAVHPFAGTTPDLAQVFDETLKWLGRYL